MIQTFKTKEEARQVTKGMRGWKIKIVNDFGIFKIRCNDRLYLRVDGFVR
jgi:uncharacterized RDD family membrane protein YckC